MTPGQDTDQIGVGVGYSAGAISASLNYGNMISTVRTVARSMATA